MSINGNQAEYYNNNQQFNSTSYPTSHSRKKSINNQNQGNMNNGQFNSQMTSGNHTATSGGRKPTADSHAYTLYKPNKANNRGKFSNGGGSIGGQGEDYDNEGQMNTSNFSAGANQTASRFYNPSK